MIAAFSGACRVAHACASIQDADEQEEEDEGLAGEAPVALVEEGAIEAYTEARQEQLKQMEEIKAKVIYYMICGGGES